MKQKEIEHLKEIIETQRKTIQALEAAVEALKNKNINYFPYNKPIPYTNPTPYTVPYQPTIQPLPTIWCNDIQTSKPVSIGGTHKVLTNGSA